MEAETQGKATKQFNTHSSTNPPNTQDDTYQGEETPRNTKFIFNTNPHILLTITLPFNPTCVFKPGDLIKGQVQAEAHDESSKHSCKKKIRKKTMDIRG